MRAGSRWPEGEAGIAVAGDEEGIAVAGDEVWIAIARGRRRESKEELSFQRGERKNGKRAKWGK